MYAFPGLIRFAGLGLAVALTVTYLAIGAAPPSAKDAAAQTVSLSIDYNDGSERRFSNIAWKPGMTAFDALKSVKQHPRGVKFTSSGTGPNLLVTQIDGLENEGGGADSKNWIFSVNNKKGNKSCAVTEIKPGDSVVWKFMIFDE